MDRYAEILKHVEDFEARNSTPLDALILVVPLTTYVELFEQLRKRAEDEGVTYPPSDRVHHTALSVKGVPIIQRDECPVDHMYLTGKSLLENEEIMRKELTRK